MADVVSRAQTIDRNDLATFLKSPRLIKQIENVILDVVDTLPSAVDGVSADVIVAQATADAAIANAATAQGTANTALANAATAQATVNTLAQRDVPLALTDAATILVNAVAHNSFSVTLGGNRTLGAPTNLADGMLLNFAIRQDGTGSRTLAYNAIYDFGAAGTPTLSTAASAVDYLTGYYDATSGKILATFRSGAATASFSAHKNGVAQSIPNGVTTKVTFGTVLWNPGTFTSSRWTPPAGLVMLNGAVYMPTANNYLQAVIYKNGVEMKWGGFERSAVVERTATVTALDLANGTDYYELWCFHSTGSAQNVDGGAAYTYFQGTPIKS